MVPRVCVLLEIQNVPVVSVTALNNAEGGPLDIQLDE